jgi:hypothetical protein
MRLVVLIVFLLANFFTFSQEKVELKEPVKEIKELIKIQPKVVVDPQLKEYMKNKKEFNSSLEGIRNQKKVDQIQLIKLTKRSPFIIEGGIDKSLSEDPRYEYGNEGNSRSINGGSAADNKEIVAEVEDPRELINSPKRLVGPSLFDSRIEVRQLDPIIDWQLAILKNNESVGVIIEKERLHLVTENLYQIDIVNKLGKTYRLCDKEPFQNQPVAGVGTAFIVGEKQMMTANHVFIRPLKDYRVVFGFEIANKNGVVNTVIHARDIYYPKKAIQTFTSYDCVTFEIDRIVKRPILQWEKSKALANSTEVYMIGHPTGLPKKIAVNAGIADNSNAQYFYTTLDSFQGNSGSPVFNRKTNKVIGVLVSGEIDYEFNGNCYQSSLCAIPYCKGEKVMRIEYLLNEQ